MNIKYDPNVILFYMYVDRNEGGRGVGWTMKD